MYAIRSYYADGRRRGDRRRQEPAVHRARLLQLNAAPFDAIKHGAIPLVGDAQRGLAELSAGLGEWRAAGSCRITSYNVCYTKLLR